VLSSAFVLAVALGGFFIPYLGYAVAVVMLVAVVMSLRKPLPAGTLSPGSKRALCGFMMFCVIGNIYRPRAWCAVCPMGTLQEMIGRKAG
jgi:hypothetical protein